VQGFDGENLKDPLESLVVTWVIIIEVGPVEVG
jgi:hypothetical protein